MYRMNYLLAVISVSLVVAGIPVRSVAAGSHHEMEEMIQNATGKADHEALAAHYEAEAKDLLAVAERHERMGARYEGVELGAKGPKFAQHCKTLAKNFRDAAGENQELAALHRELAAASGH